MKKSFLLITIVLSATSILFAQERCILSGKIINEKGEPIPYASLFIPQLSTGSMANIDGSYQLSLPCNQQEIQVQSIGYSGISLKVDMSQGSKEKDIQLSTKIYGLQEVKIGSDSEDPAYNIIRKAIVLSQYYKKQIKAYECDIYVRSFYDVDEIPYLLEKLVSEEELRDIKVGNIYETNMHYSYVYPNEVVENIKNVRSGDRDTTKTGSSYINLNFYNIGGTSIVSPLSKNAFSVYEFEFINSFLENGHIVNKIRIIPKRAGNDLMSGIIYINDKSWSLNKVDVNFRQQMVDLEYKQIYSEIKPNVWMPVNHEIRVETKLAGFKVHFQYLASLSNIEVKTDSLIEGKIRASLGQSQVNLSEAADDPRYKSPERDSSKTEKKISKLIQKEQLNKKETLQLVRLIKKQEQAEKNKSGEEALEITGSRKVEYADSAFASNDSLWDKIRTIPLSAEESSIYVSRDSLNLIIDGDTIINKERRLIANIFMFNGYLKLKDKSLRVRFPGLFRQLRIQYNTVDGLVIDKTLFSLTKTFKNGHEFYISPRIEFLTARPGMNKEFNSYYRYNGEKRARINLSAGKVSEDFNGSSALKPTINSISSLFREENFSKIYQKEYFKLSHQVDLINGLVWDVGFQYEERTQKQNNSNFTFFDSKKRSYSENFPNHRETRLMPGLISSHEAFTLESSLAYTHKHYFRMRGKKKEMLYSNYPTFRLKYRQGIPDVFGGQTQFQQLELSIEQTKSVKLIDAVSYYAGVGKFIQDKALPFADFQSFRTKPFLLSGASTFKSYRLLDYYAFNSNDFYFQGHFSIADNALLLKRTPILSNTNLEEEIHVNYLLTEQKRQFYEFGYSLNRILLFINAEAFVSFIDQKYEAFGLRLSLEIP